MYMYKYMYLNRGSSDENFDPALVKVDERKKLCLATQSFIHYYNLQIGTGRKKKSMETETTASVKQIKLTYPGDKKSSRHRPWIFS